MDPRLLDYYNRELRHVREVGGEFAQEFPKVASRLGLDGFDCADPYVERLLEGFAFLAARVHLKIDAEFPKFTQSLLEILQPRYLAPTPSMIVAQLEPDPKAGSLVEGAPVPRGTPLVGQVSRDAKTACEYRTAHDVTLWPLEVKDVEYYAGGDLRALGLGDSRIKSAVRIRLGTTVDVTIRKLGIDALQLFIRGADELPMRLYEHLVADSEAVVVRGADSADEPGVQLAGRPVRPLGFDSEESLLPVEARTFEGYRLLHEYFAFPDRFLFVELAGLRAAASVCDRREVDVFVLLSRVEPSLENSLDRSTLVPFCTPAINLFPRRADRAHVKPGLLEYHVVPDRTRPLDFEVFAVEAVDGHKGGPGVDVRFRPFYKVRDDDGSSAHAAFFTVDRRPRRQSQSQRRYGSRSSYIGSEVFISVVDGRAAPIDPGIRQLSFETLCTNRDLPLLLPIGVGATDFELPTGLPVRAARCLAGPSRPRPMHAAGETAWRLVSHLALNHLSLVDSDREHGAAAVREILRLYATFAEAHVAKQIDGVRSIASQPAVRRLPGGGPVAFGRGLEILLLCDETAFEGSGFFVLGSVLERFFGRYVSINSFTELVLESTERGIIKRWPPRSGARPLC